MNSESLTEGVDVIESEKESDNDSYAVEEGIIRNEIFYTVLLRFVDEINSIYSFSVSLTSFPTRLFLRFKNVKPA